MSRRHDGDSDLWKRELLAAGWKPRRTQTLWESPDGRLFIGPYSAWRRMVSEQTAKVDELLGRWHSATAHLSDITQAERHPAFQELLTLSANVVVPRLIERLREGKLEWVFGALRQLTGAQPVPNEHAGRVRLIAQDWIDWWDSGGKARMVSERDEDGI